MKEKKIDPLFLLFTALLCILDSEGYLLLTWAAVCLHELGHLAGLCLLRCKVERLSFGLGGLNISFHSSRQTSYGQDIVLALSGPLANVAVAAICWGICRHYPFEPLYFFLGVNVLLALFNLLPALPMDGGRVGFALLARGCKPARATTILHALTALIGTALAVLGAYVFVESGGNFTLLASAVVILSGLFSVPLYRMDRTGYDRQRRLHTMEEV